LNYYQQDDSQPRVKPDHTVVTDADLAADRLISQAIQQAYPKDYLLSEEMHTSLPADSPKHVWVVDPLDGTTNFSLGMHIWGVSIALLVDGLPEIGALYFPLVDELYTAQRGQGAYLNGKPIHVKPPKPDQPAAFFACCGRTHRRYHVSVPYKPRILGSAAYSFCTVARGVAILGFEATSKIWDIAAGWVVVQEAGGFVETHDGTQPFPLHPGAEYNGLSYPTLIASTPELLSAARQQLQRK
jgi:myo-inositol-1(or 4)-monophosphatase